MTCLFWGCQLMKPLMEGLALRCERERVCASLSDDRGCTVSRLKGTVGLPYTLWLPLCVASPCLFQKVPEVPADTCQREAHEKRSFIFQMRADSLYIDEIEALTAKSKQYFAIFKILWGQYCKDLCANQTAEHYTLLSSADIADRMPGHVEDIDTVRRYIKHLQENMSRLLKNAHGSSVEREAIIQSLVLKDFGRKKHGYRLNPYTLHIVPC